MFLLQSIFSLISGRIERWVALVLRFVDHRRKYTSVLRVGHQDMREARSVGAPWWRGDPRWFAGGTSPREHNRVTPLIDGESYFAALQEALDQAREYVYVVGWCLTPHIPISRANGQDLVDTQLLHLLSRAAQRVPVRILLWSGAPFIYQPVIGRVNDVKATIEKECTGDIVCHLDRTAHFTHCHHQKAIVVDGGVAFVGGMDLTTFTGDRWDTSSHPLRAGINWHDIEVRIEGEAVADVEQNFRQRWEGSGGDLTGASLPHKDPEVSPSWNTPVQIVRTVPAGIYPFAPRGEFGILHFYAQAIRRARRLVYLENQYIWSPHIMNALKYAMNAPHEEPFRIVLVLPAHAGDGRWDNDKHVAELRKMDKGRGIISIYSLYTSGTNMGDHAFSYRAIYVHAKVAVIDDEWLTVGSANLNNRGFITDGEINAVVHDAELARRVRVDLWTEHLGLPREQVDAASPAQLADHEWTCVAARNAETIKSGDRPLEGAAHEYIMGRAPGAFILEDIQSLTFEY